MDTTLQDRESALGTLSENAMTVLKSRYLKKDENGRVVETPDEMFHRVARSIAKIDALYDPNADVEKIKNEFYEMISNLEFLPNSPTIMNSGTDLGQLSACFVLPIDDSIESIFDAVKQTALIHKSGGGTGFSFSNLRPKNDSVKSTGGIASGPVSFMQVFDSATEVIKQGGRRRGANMGILSVEHPDIIDFIRSKEDGRSFNNFNISVALTDKFMEAVERNEGYDLITPRTKQVVKRIPAREVFDLIVNLAWKNGEPGIVFIDRINLFNPTPDVGAIESTNPCGEQPLLPYESCNLGSINLSKMVENGKINFQRLKNTVKIAVHFLDNVIDANKYPLSEIERMTKANRKIGLGVMGFADMLLQMNIPYNSEEAITVAEEVMKAIQETSKEATSELAEKRNCFPNYYGSIYNNPDGIKVRNATTTTIAPTGTLSIIAGCSSGIEPLYAICFSRNVLDGKRLIEINPLFEKIAKESGFYSDDLIKKITIKGSIKNIDEVPEDVKKIFMTAHDITPEWHIRMQSAFQKYTDNAVSKTVNFPHNAVKDDIKKVYMLAYNLSCKGVTVYRDGSREKQVLETEKTEKARNNEKHEKKQNLDKAVGLRLRKKTGCGTIYTKIFSGEDSEPFEIFITLGKAGGCAAAFTEGLARSCSLALKYGASMEELEEQLIGISCHKQEGFGRLKTLSCIDAVAKSLREIIGENEEITFPPTQGASFRLGACPKCGSQVMHTEGCIRCVSCDFSQCE
jgi:ribonucleoside-diphosphate reductase alpha chain